ncbi:MAG: TrkA family potassium uptake protein [Clostridia bacterium]|nr:TrkA family potassium uptake protein [Clostridia bacterium]
MGYNKTYAVFGLGRYGLSVAKELVSNGADVIAVDTNQRIVEEYASIFPVCKCADITDPDVIERLGMSSVDTVIISMASNLEASVMAIMLCKNAGVKEVIVKCANDMHKRIFEKVGADIVVFPENESGKRLAKNLLSSGFIDVADLSDEISIVEIDVLKKWNGKTLKELDLRRTHSLNVIAIKSNGSTELVSNPDMVLSENMKLVIIAHKRDVEKIK